MSLKTRWFGKKVEGKPLRDLVSALGGDPSKLLGNSPHGWNKESEYGRASFKPVEKGVNVDLYVFTNNYRVLYNTSNSDNADEHSQHPKVLLFSPTDPNNRIIQRYSHYIQGQIKYNNEEDKLKKGTGTGKGVSI